MNRFVEIEGYCPTQNKEYSIVRTMIDAGDGTYLKGTMCCDYTKYDGECECSQKCPINKK